MAVALGDRVEVSATRVLAPVAKKQVFLHGASPDIAVTACDRLLPRLSPTIHTRATVARLEFCAQGAARKAPVRASASLMSAGRDHPVELRVTFAVAVLIAGHPY